MNKVAKYKFKHNHGYYDFYDKDEAQVWSLHHQVGDIIISDFDDDYGTLETLEHKLISYFQLNLKLLETLIQKGILTKQEFIDMVNDLLPFSNKLEDIKFIEVEDESW